MASGGLFAAITNDARQDRMLLASGRTSKMLTKAEALSAYREGKHVSVDRRLCFWGIDLPRAKNKFVSCRKYEILCTCMQFPAMGEMFVLAIEIGYALDRIGSSYVCKLMSDNSFKILSGMKDIVCSIDKQSSIDAVEEALAWMPAEIVAEILSHGTELPVWTKICCELGIAESDL